MSDRLLSDEELRDILPPFTYKDNQEAAIALARSIGQAQDTKSYPS